MHFLLTLLGACALTYALLCAALYIFQARFVFFPSARMHATPADSAMEFEEVSLPSSGDARISAWFVPSPRDRGTLLFCHGNAGNISDRVELIELFHAMGLNHLFNYLDGQPDAFKYDLVSLYLLEVVKQHEKSNQKLQNQVDSLTQRLAALEAALEK